MEQHTLNFKGSNGYPSACEITIYRQTNIIIATDIDQGMSVTNACEIIANAVVQWFNVNPHTMFFIEQYRPGRPDQTTDLVKFDFADGKAFRRPQWSHIAPDEFNKIIALATELE